MASPADRRRRYFGRNVEAFGGIPAFTAQLTPNLDDWIARLDSAFMPGGMGHHGVSAGDAYGDGLDNL